MYFILLCQQKTVFLMSVVSLVTAYPGYADHGSIGDGKIPTTHSIDTRPVPVPVYQKVPVDIPSPVPVAVPNYVKVQM